MTSIVLGPDSTGATLVVDGETIAEFGVSSKKSRGGIDCADGVIVPGGVNAHTHMYSGLAPLGMPPPEHEPANFIEILEQVWWRLDRALDAASLRAAARLYSAEALLAGTTVLIDHHESPNLIEGSLDIIADACEEVGVRALVCYGATERNDGAAEAGSGLGECRRFIVSNHRNLVRAAVGLHASFTVSDATIREAGELCRASGAPLHVHVAEDRADVDDARERGYEGPLQRLHLLRALEPRSIVAHGVHLSEEEVRSAERLRLWIVQNPRSNRGNRVGYASSLGASWHVALGTDGYPADMNDEAVALQDEAQRAGERAAVVGDRLAAGHRLAGELFGIHFAPLARGAAADAVVISDHRVRHVIVAGRLVVRDGELQTADMKSIHEEAAREAPRLWERMRATPVKLWKDSEFAGKA